MVRHGITLIGLSLTWLLADVPWARHSQLAAYEQQLVDQVRSLVPDQRGIVAVVSDSDSIVDSVVALASETELTVYFQTSSEQVLQALRAAAEKSGMLGKRIFADQGEANCIPLSHNLADAVVIGVELASRVPESEVLRILRPLGHAMLGEQVLTKPIPEGSDDWSHPYHGPDNNTQSDDQLVRGDFQTQFIGYPQFSPMPEQTVIAGGRIYKAMGHIAHKANQNEMLNTLLCINAYNGSILWRRPLSEGFMIHRNTMVATQDALYMGDHESCKVIDAITGQQRKSFQVDPALTDGPVWKWMALEGDILYALVGNREVEIRTVRSNRPGIGHWPWGMWDGHDYNDPRTSFGHGRTLVALDRNTGRLLWHYRDQNFLDARAICMKNNRIYAYCPEQFLICVDATTGRLIWRNEDRDLLEAIGPNEKAQHYVTGYATSAYMKCSDDYLFFAGPQRARMVVASSVDGSLLWTNDVGNLQLVLRPEAIYAAGPERTRGMLLDYKTGKEIASLPARRACTRATGCADSVFFRASGGTVRIMAATADQGVTPKHIAPMRPPCQDGVLVSNGHLYWGPWMCGCQLSLYANIGLRPVGEQNLPPRDVQSAKEQSLVRFPGYDSVQSIGASPEDWTTFLASSDHSSRTSVAAPRNVRQAWSLQAVSGHLPTAPIAAGGLVFFGDRRGAVHAVNAKGQKVWTTHTGGAIFYPPTLAHDRLYVGSADGRVYALEAATGRVLWKYLVAPEDRRIAFFEQLVSRWPVAGGVLVDGDRVFAAAGITHYDGTYVVALDAFSGFPLAINDTSGRLSEFVDSGISMQGELSIKNGELQFAGGGIYEVARYRLDDLVCLNEPRHEISSQFRTAFYAWYPVYNKFVSLEQALPDGRVLSFDANYDGSEFHPLSLEPPRPLGLHGKMQKDLAGEFLRRRGKEAPPAYVWQDSEQHRFSAFALHDDLLVAAGHPSSSPERPVLMAISVDDGQVQWKHNLPADVVKGGLAVDAASRIVVTMENGQLACFEPTAQ